MLPEIPDQSTETRLGPGESLSNEIATTREPQAFFGGLLCCRLDYIPLPLTGSLASFVRLEVDSFKAQHPFPYGSGRGDLPLTQKAK